MLRAMLSRIQASFRPHQLNQEFDEEIQTHLDLLAERFIRQGMDPVEAVYAARRQFGGVTQMKQELRERRVLLSLDVLIHDVKHAFRQMRTAKWFTVSSSLTLALGIGASAAVFSVLDTVVLKPLPYAKPDRLMAFRSLDRRGPHPSPLSYPNFFDFRSRNRVFEHLVSYRDEQFTLTDSLPPIQVSGEVVSWDLFPLLGVRPELGRSFRPEEEQPGTHVVMLSHSLWQSRFGGNPEILKHPIRINGQPFVVAGIAPASFRFPLNNPAVEMWTTLAEDATVSNFTPLTEQRGARVLETIGRLKPTISAQQAQAQMDQIAGALAQEDPDNNKNIQTTIVTPEQEFLTGRSRKPLWILLGAAGLLLLIACANVANLLLTRSTERWREFTIRSVMGAPRLALVRQLLIESLVLGLAGSAIGILLAFGILKAILPLAGNNLLRLSQAGIDGRVLAFSTLLALFTSVLFSVVPIIQVVRGNLAGTLKESAMNIARGNHRLRSVLIVSQIALGLVLVVGAEFLMASFLHLTRRNPGFRADNLLTFNIGLSDERYTTAAQIAFSDRLLEQLRTIPGVQDAAAGTPLPLQGDQMSVAFDIEERPMAPPDRSHSDMAIVTPDYFHTMGVPLLKGRNFREQDDVHAPRVLIVNRAFARKYFPGEEVLGKRVKSGATNGKEGMQWREIIGVVEDAKQVPLGVDPDPIYYFPYKQLSWTFGSLVLRTAVPPREVESAVRATLASLDRQAPMYDVRTGEDLTALAIAQPRFQTALMNTFAAIALLLTLTGLYSVLSYTVAKRRREIGVRIALGAARGKVIEMILRQAALLVTAGLILGLLGAFGAGRLLESMAFGIHPSSPIIIASACCLMLITSLAAAYVPARKAASVDPSEALRSE